ncbi:MAG: hypothetical protein PHS93_08020 [Candidatus Omnitrophica bacterium]|nr:hypothetical protein [Candidatus Omnitrophota bacterium]
MKSPLVAFINQSGDAFPGTLAVNSSGALSTDGTEFISDMVNDYMFGLMQALLAYTGQTPNGTLEGPSNSQFLEGIRRFTVYPGSIFHAAWNVDPSTIPIRAIKLTGQGIVRANYPLLDAMVYCGDANNATYTAFFRADNADGSSRNIAGAYLILPDMRGRVIRALDTAAGVDPDGASRYLGSLQNHAFMKHWHNFQAERLDNIAVTASTTGMDNIAGTGVNLNTLVKDAVTDGVTGAPLTSTETRMTNASFDCYIVY